MASVKATGTLDAANGSVRMQVLGMRSMALQVTGTFTGTITFEGSLDGRNYQTLQMVQSNAITEKVTSTTTTGLWIGALGGLLTVRARMSSYTSGIATVVMQAVEGQYEFVEVAGGGVVASALRGAGTLYAPDDLGFLPSTLEAPTAAIYSIDTVSQSDAITAVNTGAKTFTVVGDRSATYPAASRIRVYDSEPGGD